MGESLDHAFWDGLPGFCFTLCFLFFKVDGEGKSMNCSLIAMYVSLDLLYHAKHFFMVSSFQMRAVLGRLLLSIYRNIIKMKQLDVDMSPPAFYFISKGYSD